MQFILIIIFLIIGDCYAQENISDKKAVLSIIGEAENQDCNGMLAVACAIRNRGTLKGVYGWENPRVIHHKYSNETYLKAFKAWRLVNENNGWKYCRPLKGATHWENIKAFGKPYWVKNMIETYRYKNHVFYK